MSLSRESSYLITTKSPYPAEVIFLVFTWGSMSIVLEKLKNEKMSRNRSIQIEFLPNNAFSEVILSAQIKFPLPSNLCKKEQRDAVVIESTPVPGSMSAVAPSHPKT